MRERLLKVHALKIPLSTNAKRENFLLLLFFKNIWWIFFPSLIPLLDMETTPLEKSYFAEALQSPHKSITGISSLSLILKSETFVVFFSVLLPACTATNNDKEKMDQILQQ